MRVSLLLLLLLSVLSGPAAASEGDWIPTLDEGLKEARKCGKAVLYVTKWKPKV